MPVIRKRSAPGEQLVPISEAASLLSISVRTLEKYIRSGVVETVQVPGTKERHLHLQTVTALGEVLQKKMSLEQIANLAMQAFVKARANEQRLNDLVDSLGLHRVELSLEENAIIELYTRAADTQGFVGGVTTEELREWAAIFFSIDNSYLQLVDQHTSSEEPWKAFLDMAALLISHTPREQFSYDTQLRAASAYLVAAQEHLRAVSYFFCRKKYGKAAADVVFNGPADVTDRIIGALFT